MKVKKEYPRIHDDAFTIDVFPKGSRHLQRTTADLTALAPAKQCNARVLEGAVHRQTS